uniref:Uncharacterized protein LOC111107918 n=1 Tax=Crassostrea virginica TaxID=6565 RepID=A0A8B8B7I2_CRAVI|nr:uncharacterized protein LOC111107918 [Crassostrea virginica]
MPPSHSTWRKSDGFSFTVKLQGDRVTYWWCSVCPKIDRCRATIEQKGCQFIPGVAESNRFAKPGLHTAAVVRREIKKHAKAQIFRAAGTIVEEIMGEQCDVRTPGASWDHPRNLSRAANSYRGLQDKISIPITDVFQFVV